MSFRFLKMEWNRVFFLLLTTIINTDAGIFQKTVLKIHSFEGYCDEYGITTIGFENITLRTHSSRMTIMDATMVVRENLTHNYMQEVGLTKCKDMYTPDSCVNFKTLKFPDICKMYDAKNQMWSPFTTKYQPKIECPIREGRYSVEGGYFDMSKSPIFVEPNNFWKVRIIQHDLTTKTVVLCLNLGLEVLPKKNDS